VTETQWLACVAAPERMVKAICNRVSDRKLRLFAVACVRSILPRSRDVHRGTVAQLAEMAEAFIDGMVPAIELNRAHTETIPWDHEVWAAIQACHPEARLAAIHTVRAGAKAAQGLWLAAHGYPQRSPEALAARRIEFERQTVLARCVFGNPFRRVALAAQWRTGTVLALARAVYEDRAFERLPILGDAIEEAGCSEVELLAHCRSSGPHVRGCWVIDLLRSDYRGGGCRCLWCGAVENQPGGAVRQGHCKGSSFLANQCRFEIR
jgi:hypothetical protein